MAPHILVIDGDDELLERTQVVLETAGYRVTTADMPDIGIVRRLEPNAIVAGLFYRGEPTGIDFLEHHAADPATAAVPVVVHASASELTSAQWNRLVALAHPVLDRTGGPETGAVALIEQVRAVLATATPFARPETAGRASQG